MPYTNLIYRDQTGKPVAWNRGKLARRSEVLRELEARLNDYLASSRPSYKRETFKLDESHIVKGHLTRIS